MVKWEYCRIIWIIHDVSEQEQATLRKQGFLKAFKLNEDIVTGGYLKFLGTEKEVERITDLGERIAQLGLEGWELVTHTPVISPANIEFFYLKRVILR